MSEAGPPTAPAPRVRPASWQGGAAGAVSVGIAFGLTELFAGLIDGVPSAISSIGAVVVSVTPPAVEDAAIGLFGTNDKAALAVGTVVIGLAVGWFLGVRALDRFGVAVRGFVAFALLGVAAVAADALADTLLGALAVLVSAAGGVLALRWLVDVAVSDQAAAATAGDPQRRRFVSMALGVGAAALVAGAAGRMRLTSRGRVDIDDLVLPAPVTEAPLAGSAARFDVPGLVPVVVPNEEFYRIDTALIVPRVDPSEWSLRIHGLVDRELRFTLDDLYAMEHVERYVTIACVSNEVGGDLVGNARWQGVPLAPLLERAGVREGAGQVVGRSVDGWTAGFPTEVVFDGRDPLIALGMNGEPLPADHGFPARLIVPGLYGYVSATKWLSEVELTTWEDFDGYWVPRGWSKEGPIKLQSRIDVPRQGSDVPAGDVVVAGVAWAGLAGIARVEIAVDDGGWTEAELTEPLSDAAWVQWRVTLPLAEGRHRLEVRATDGSGVVQTDQRSGVRPDGATGHHAITIRAV